MRNELGGKPRDLVPAIPYGIGPVSGLAFGSRFHFFSVS